MMTGFERTEEGPVERKLRNTSPTVSTGDPPDADEDLAKAVEQLGLADEDFEVNEYGGLDGLADEDYGGLEEKWSPEDGPGGADDGRSQGSIRSLESLGGGSLTVMPDPDR